MDDIEPTSVYHKNYDLSTAILSSSKIVYFNKNLHCCHGRRHDVTYSRRKCFVACEDIIQLLTYVEVDMECY